jgi:hypothetical protein
MTGADTRSLILVGVVLGLTAAFVVWWLERFELQKIRGEIRDTLAGEASNYLGRWDEYKQWLREHGRADD